MAITTYSELQAAVASWVERSDLTARIPEFIALFEGRARRELRSWLATTVTATDVEDDYSLGTTVEAVLGVAYNDGAGGTYNHALDLITFADYHERMAHCSTVRAPTQAVFVDRDESANTTILRFYPPVSESSPIDALAVEVVGFLPALSDAATSNRLLVAAPDLYLKGSLVEASQYLQHDERVDLWRTEVLDGIHKLNMQTDRKRFGGAPRTVRLPVVFG